MLRACAWASPGEDGKDRDYYYQQHMNTLVTSRVWKQNPQVVQWLNGAWLKCPQVCNLVTTVQPQHGELGEWVGMHYIHATCTCTCVAYNIPY